MLELHKYEGKSKDNILENIEQKLKITEEQLFYKETETEQGLFKSKKISIECITKEEINEYIKKYINKLSYYMNINMKQEIYFDDNLIKIVLLTDNNNILIGKEGKTLNSIQILIRQYLRELKKFDIKIIVDISNYKEKNQKKLEKQVKQICEEILTTKLEVKLDPMNSYERRLVHSIVANYELLISISYGEEPNRYTIIKYKD